MNSLLSIDLGTALRRLAFLLFPSLLLNLSSPTQPLAQYEFSFSGYVIDLPFYQHNKEPLAQVLAIEEIQLFNLTRLRLRPTLYLGEDTRLVLEYEVNSLIQSTRLSFGNLADRHPRQLKDLTWQPVHEVHMNFIHFIDRLYFRKNFSSVSLSIGRQRISWGTGRIWNPTDLFNPINPANFSKLEKDGADVISFKIYLNDFTDWQWIYNPEDEFRENNFASRFRSHLGEYDFSILTGYINRHLILGGDFAGNLFDAGLRGEGLFSTSKDNLSNHFLKWILGIDYQFTARWYGLMEFHHNGEGTTDRRQYDLPRLFRGEILNVGKDYLFLQATYQIHPLWQMGGFSNTNLHDVSGFIGLNGIYSLSNNSSLTLGGQIFYGDQWDEYWYYPTALYAKVEFYF